MSLELFRIFPWDKVTRNPFRYGGPFFVPRSKQGSGRHDIPHLDGILYTSLELLSVFAEHIQGFRGTALRAEDLDRPDGLVNAVAQFRLEDESNLLNLDDPHVLSRYQIRPSQVMTRHRPTTRDLSQRLYNTGASGFLWPSSLESSWINASLYFQRVQSSLSLSSEIRPVSVEIPEFRAAAEVLGIKITK